MQSGLKNLQFASETSQTCVRNVRKGGQEFFSRAKTFFFRGKNFFFQGQKLFFSGASKTSTKRTHPRGPKPEKRSGHERKSPKLFFLLDQTFFLGALKVFRWGAFFVFGEGFSGFSLRFPTPIQKVINVTAPELHHHAGGPNPGKKWPRRGQPRYGYMKSRCTPAHPPRQPKAKNSKNLNLGPQTASFGAKLYANRRSSTSCVDPARFQHQRTQS